MVSMLVHTNEKIPVFNNAIALTDINNDKKNLNADMFINNPEEYNDSIDDCTFWRIICKLKVN